MANKLPDHRKAMQLNMVLNRTGDIGNSVANSGLLDTFQKRRLRYLHQKRNFWYDIFHRNGDCGITIKPLIINTKIKGNNITRSKNLLF